MIRPDTYETRQLLWQIAQGDSLAFKQLFERFYDRFYSTALMYLKTHEAAEDLVQHIFMRIWEKRQTLTPGENPDGYLFIMARNEIISVLRKKAIDTRFIDFVGELFADEKDSPEEALIVKQKRELLEQAIQQLPPQIQQAYRLSKERGLSYEEIARVMNLSLNTVRGYISTALHTLRASLLKTGLYSVIIFFSLGTWF